MKNVPKGLSGGTINLGSMGGNPGGGPLGTRVGIGLGGINCPLGRIS